MSAPTGPPQQQQQQQGQGQDQGQLPMLIDALCFLDEIKIQLTDRPDIYTEFLEIMRAFKREDINILDVMGRVGPLFAGYPDLIEDFNAFLPPGYRI